MLNITEDGRPKIPPSPACRETLSVDVVEGLNGLLLTVTYAGNMLFIIVANIALIYGLVKTSGRKFTSSTKYFLVLSSSDLLGGVVLMPLQLYVIQAVPDVPCYLTGVRAFFYVFPLTLSGMIIMVLTIDRYVVMSGRRKQTRSAGYRDIILNVSMALLVSCGWGVWYTMSLQQTSFKRLAVFFVSLGVFEACILITSVVFNFLILQKVKETSRNTTIQGNKRKAEQSLSKTITLISGSLVVMYTPSVIGLFVAGQFFYNLTTMDIIRGKVTRKDIQHITTGLIWSLLPTLVNSGLNACIYMLRNKRMRRMYTSIYKRNGNRNFENSEDFSSSRTLSRNGSAKVSNNNIRLNTLNNKFIKINVQNNQTTKISN